MRTARAGPFRTPLRHAIGTALRVTASGNPNTLSNAQLYVSVKIGKNTISTASYRNACHSDTSSHHAISGIRNVTSAT